jgi:hypothetical protein
VAVEIRTPPAEVKKTKATGLTPSLPASTAIGDLLVLAVYVQPSTEGAGPFTVTTPEGWTRGTGGEVNMTEGSSHVTVVMFWRVLTSLVLPEIKVSGESTIDIAATAFVGGTFSSSTPIIAQSEWRVDTTSGTASATMPGTQTVAVMGLAIALGKGITGTASGWTEILGLVNNNEFDKAIAANEIPPGWTYKKSTTKPAAGMVLFVQEAPSAALKGTSAATASMAGKPQAPGVPKGASSATGTAAGRPQAPGVPRGHSTATATAAGRLQTPGVLKGAAGATATGAGRLQAEGALKGSLLGTATARAAAQAAGVLRGASVATGVARGLAGAVGALRGASAAVGAAAGRLQAGGVLRGATGAAATAVGRLAGVAGLRGQASATGTAAGRAQAAGGLRGAAGATADALGRLAGGVGLLRGRSSATGTSAGAAQAPGVLRGQRISSTGDAHGRLQGAGTLAGSSAATAAMSGAGGALGWLRGRVEAVATFAGRLIGPSAAKTCDVELSIRPTVSANVGWLSSVEAAEVEVEAVVSANVMIVGGGV